MSILSFVKKESSPSGWHKRVPVGTFGCNLAIRGTPVMCVLVFQQTL